MLNIKLSPQQNFIIITFMCCVLMILTSCLMKPKKYYVESIDKYIEVVEIKDGDFRIYIYNSDSSRGTDYIDVGYKASEMPSITLYFMKNDPLSIYIYDRGHGEVKIINSSRYNIIYPDADGSNFISLGRYLDWCDSISSLPSAITVRLDAYMNGLSVWDENGTYNKIYEQNN